MYIHKYIDIYIHIHIYICMRLLICSSRSCFHFMIHWERLDSLMWTPGRCSLVRRTGRWLSLCLSQRSSAFLEIVFQKKLGSYREYSVINIVRQSKIEFLEFPQTILRIRMQPSLFNFVDSSSNHPTYWKCSFLLLLRKIPKHLFFRATSVGGKEYIPFSLIFEDYHDCVSILQKDA